MGRKGTVTETMAGTLTITRPSNHDSDIRPMIRFRVRVGERLFRFEMTAEEFALGITGLSERPVAVDVRDAAPPPTDGFNACLSCQRTRAEGHAPTCKKLNL
jgi:hypothetical protein